MLDAGVQIIFAGIVRKTERPTEKTNCDERDPWASSRRPRMASGLNQPAGQSRRPIEQWARLSSRGCEEGESSVHRDVNNTHANLVVVQEIFSQNYTVPLEIPLPERIRSRRVSQIDPDSVHGAKLSTTRRPPPSWTESPGLAKFEPEPTLEVSANSNSIGLPSCRSCVTLRQRA
jgi:hypothetical protein